MKEITKKITIDLSNFDEKKPVVILDLHNGTLQRRMEELLKLIREDAQMMCSQGSLNILVKDLSERIKVLPDFFSAEEFEEMKKA